MTRMTVSVNNESGVPYVQYGTDRQKAHAAKFAKANDKQLNYMARAIADSKNKKQDNRFAKGIALAILSLPVVGGAVTAAATKGKVSQKTIAGAKAFAKNAAGLGLGFGIVEANSKAASKNPTLNKIERKHPFVTLLGMGAAASSIASIGIAVSEKISPKATEKLKTLGKKVKLDVLARKMDKAPEAVRGFASKIAEKISLPQGVKDSLATISSKIKMPARLKEGMDSIKNKDFYKSTVANMKKFGKELVKHPVTAGSIAIVGAIIGMGVKKAVQMSHEKTLLKQDQLKTANALIDAYAKENESLKAANSKAAAALEEGNKVVSEDSDDSAKAKEIE